MVFSSRDIVKRAAVAVASHHLLLTSTDYDAAALGFATRISFGLAIQRLPDCTCIMREL